MIKVLSTLKFSQNLNLFLILVSLNRFSRVDDENNY